MTRATTGGMRGAVLFALLALLVQVLVPPGFMPAGTGNRLALVICTGHGPMQMGAPDHGAPQKAPGRTADHVCAFAGHGPALAAPPLVRQAVAGVEPVILPEPRRPDLAPGRGLAAPPPPSHAPPPLLA